LKCPRRPPSLPEAQLTIARAELSAPHATIEPMLRLMCITAHPDDEAGGFGGVLRLYADRGVETCVLCLTPGQAATNRGDAKDDHALATMRRKEFAASCEILGVSRGIVLDFPDGQLHRQDLYRVVRDLTLHVREFRPQVVLTFGPEGGVTAHTDHSMVSLFATLTFHWAGRENRFPDQFGGSVAAHQAQKLYYSTYNFTLPGRPAVALPPTSATVEIGDLLETKLAAFKAHISQAPLWPILEKALRKAPPQERFHLAATAKPEPAVEETDLFAGVTGGE
jgi:LmbE family N-acetylglucosaminyl deacetylase